MASKPARHREFGRRFTTDSALLHRIDPATGQLALMDKQSSTYALNCDGVEREDEEKKREHLYDAAVDWARFYWLAVKTETMCAKAKAVIHILVSLHFHV